MDNRKPLENLANAIIKQACDDWLNSDYLRIGDQKEENGTYYNRDECEQFFRSQWFGTLTGLDPEYLIAKLKAIDRKRRRKRA